MWHCWGVLLGLLGASDMASVVGFEGASSRCQEALGGVTWHCLWLFQWHWELVMWHWWGALLGAFGGHNVASLGAGRIDELTPDWPESGQLPEGSTVVVAAMHNGGGGG